MPSLISLLGSRRLERFVRKIRLEEASAAPGRPSTMLQETELGLILIQFSDEASQDVYNRLQNAVDAVTKHGATIEASILSLLVVAFGSLVLTTREENAEKCKNTSNELLRLFGVDIRIVYGARRYRYGSVFTSQRAFHGPIVDDSSVWFDALQSTPFGGARDVCELVAGGS